MLKSCQKFYDYQGTETNVTKLQLISMKYINFPLTSTSGLLLKDSKILSFRMKRPDMNLTLRFQFNKVWNGLRYGSWDSSVDIAPRL
jgi:hypothetical protein